MANPNEGKKSLATSSASTKDSIAKMRWLNERLAAADLMKPSPPLDELGHELTVKLWLKTLDEIGEERFDAALQAVLETTTFRPDISEIRKLAGVQVDQEAMRELAKLIKLQRHHGRKLTNRGKPEKEPPGPLADVTMATISDMGFGSVRAGLEAVWAHPALDLVRPPAELDEMESFRAVAAKRIEQDWVKFYTQRKAKGGCGDAVR